MNFKIKSGKKEIIARNIQFLVKYNAMINV